MEIVVVQNLQANGLMAKNKKRKIDEDEIASDEVVMPENVEALIETENFSKNGKERKKHPVWQYFECIKDVSGEKAKCNLCTKRSSIIVATTTAMKKHLKSFHRKEDKLLEKRVQLFEKSRRISKAKKDEEQNEVAKSFSFEERKQTKKFGSSHPRKKDCDRAMALLLSDPCLSLNYFLSPITRTALSLFNPKYNPPKSLKGLRALLSKSHTNIRTNLARILSSLQFRPTISADVWTGNEHSYLGITVYLIYENCLRNYFLGVKEMTGEYTAATVKACIEELLGEYNLSIEKCFRIVTDGGRNFVAAFRNFEDFCSVSYEDDFEFLYPQQLCDTFDIDMDAFIDVTASKRIICASSQLQRVLIYGTYRGMNMNDLENARTLITTLNESDINAGLNRRRKKVEQSATCPTKWDNLISALEDFQEIDDNLKLVTDTRHLSFPKSDDFSYLRKVLDLFKIFDEALRTFQNDGCTISQLFFHLKIIGEHLDTFKNTELNGLASELQDEIESENRFGVCFPHSANFEPVYIVSTALDPNTNYCLTEEERCDCISYIYTMLNSEGVVQIDQENVLAHNSHDPIQDLPIGMKISTPLYHSNRRDIAEMMKEKALLEVSITKALQLVFSVTPENDEAIDIFSFWNDVFESDEGLKFLKPFVYQLFSVPLAAAPVERVFCTEKFAERQNGSHAIELLNEQLMVYLNAESSSKNHLNF